MARAEKRTIWTITDEHGATATIRMDSNDGDRAVLKIEQGEDHMVWLSIEALPQMLTALTALNEEYLAAP